MPKHFTLFQSFTAGDSSDMDGPLRPQVWHSTRYLGSLGPPASFTLGLQPQNGHAFGLTMASFPLHTFPKRRALSGSDSNASTNRRASREKSS